MRKIPVSVPQEGFHYDDPSHSYYFDGKPMTGCTTILGVLAKPALIPWAAKMAVEHVKQNTGRIVKEEWNGNTLYNCLNEDELNLVLEEAKNAHRKKKEDAAQKGTDLHALVEEYVGLMIRDQDGRALEMNDDPTHYWQPISPFIQWAKKENVRFLATEQVIYSKKLWVAGTCDLIFEKGGKRYIGDIKTYKKIWDRVPLIQCAGYSIMYEEMQGVTEHLKPIAFGSPLLTHEQINPIDGYCVICLPKERAFNEVEDVLWSWDIEGDKEAFLAAVKLYRYLNQ